MFKRKVFSEAVQRLQCNQSDNRYVHENRVSVYYKTKTERFIHSEDTMNLSTELGQKSTFSVFVDLNLDRLTRAGKAENIFSSALDVERLLGVLVGNFNVE